ncbi:MAG TPA: hypothetical protein VJ921_10395 [Vicinamibacteria bacterium]|nr:hypothetical protein [Vicinamibacteria bacterium]
MIGRIGFSAILLSVVGGALQKLTKENERRLEREVHAILAEKKRATSLDRRSSFPLLP